MVKNIIFVVIQFILFIVVCFLGIALPALHMIPSCITTLADGTRGFEWDGVFFMLGLLVVILGIEAARKRLRTAAAWTFLALALAGIAEFALKVGVRDL